MPQININCVKNALIPSLRSSLLTGEARCKYYHSIYKLNGFASRMCVCINLWDHLATLGSFIIDVPFMIWSSTKVCVLLCQRGALGNLFKTVILCLKKLQSVLLRLYLSHFTWQLVLMPSTVRPKELQAKKICNIINEL